MKSRFVHFVNLFVGSFLSQRNRTENKKTKSVNYGRVSGGFEATNTGLFRFSPECEIRRVNKTKSLAEERERVDVHATCRLGLWSVLGEDETQQRPPSSLLRLLNGILF